MREGAVRRWAGVAALLALMSVVGFLAAIATPESGRARAFWPVGIATVCLIIAPRRAIPGVLALIAAIAAVTITVGGRPVEVASGFAVGIAAEAWVVGRILTGGRPGRPSCAPTGT